MRWAVGLSLLIVASAGCKKTPSFGQAVAVTIKGSALSTEARASVRNLTINGSGAETYSGNLPTPKGIGAVEKTVYRPNVGTGSLQIAVTAFDGSGVAVGYGSGETSLAPGKTVELTIALSSDVPALDMAAGMDLSGADFAGADLAAVDFAVPPDLLPVVVTPAAVWTSSGGGAGDATSGAKLGLSIGGTVVGSSTVTGSSGASLSFGKLGTAR